MKEQEFKITDCGPLLKYLKQSFGDLTSVGTYVTLEREKIVEEEVEEQVVKTEQQT